MPIEKSLERIAVALEDLVRIYDTPDILIPNPDGKPPDVKIKPSDVEYVLGRVNVADELFPAIEENKKEKPKKKAKEKKKAKPKKKTNVTMEDMISTKPKKLTIEDVRDEARELVDGFKQDQKGYNKAQEILRALGTASLRELVPEKYTDAINAFRRTVVILKGGK